MTLENTIEAYLVKRVKELGGFSLKTDRVEGRRFVDRTCFLPGGRTLIVECKRPKGGRRQALQVHHIDLLVEMGHEAHFCKTKEEIDAALSHT